MRGQSRDSYILSKLDIVLKVPILEKASSVIMGNKSAVQKHQLAQNTVILDNMHDGNAYAFPINESSSVECVCCSDSRRCILMFPCGHLYCKVCIGTMFAMALKDCSRVYSYEYPVRILIIRRSK